MLFFISGEQPLAFIYPIIILLIVDNLSTRDYFKNPQTSFSQAFTNLAKLAPVDIVIFLSGFVGVLLSGIVIKLLRESGYQMFRTGINLFCHGKATPRKRCWKWQNKKCAGFLHVLPLQRS